METCYKMFQREITQRIGIEENRIGFEPEVTGKIAAIPGIRIYEVGISYSGRSYEEGKKIGWRDGVRAGWCILKYRPSRIRRRIRRVGPGRALGQQAAASIAPAKPLRPADPPSAKNVRSI